MSKKGNKNVVWEIFKESHVIVLTTHVRPDGDGIASELSLYFILSSMGKVVYIVNQDRTPDIYSWLPDADRIITLEENDSIQIPAIDLTVLLDCSSSNRIGRVYDLFKDSKKIISLDHHEDSECFRDYCYIEELKQNILMHYGFIVEKMTMVVEHIFIGNIIEYI